MNFRTNVLFLDSGQIELPTMRIVCPSCDGTGKSSSYLGAFTSDEFDNQFDPEEQEAYFAGAYDKVCDQCEGRNVIEVVNEDRIPAGLVAAYRAQQDAEARDDAEAAMERRMGA